ncbi:MAG: efflux RND transporter periplasmic adaptor subunit [Desulfotignum sp.]|nr:efflux RND transporter periplasmic adaptor subunit [Desulfotignum sp.]MCF8126013.1 efflux RND transporter periplasmic adaptor subunit [Desulfotignum sp.]
MSPGSRIKKVAAFMFRFLRVALVLGVAWACAFWLYENRTTPEKKPRQVPVPMVRVISLTPESKVMTVTAFGTVTPRREVKISPEIPGRINRLHPGFAAGGEFKKNDLLVGIDPEPFRLDLLAAQVRISQAQADIRSLEQEIKNLEKDKELYQAALALAKKELDRVKNLSARDFASKNSLDSTEQQVLSARIQHQAVISRLAMTTPLMAQKQAALAMARVDAQKADLALQKTQILADFDGFVLVRSARTGEYVTPGQVLAVIYEKGALDVDVKIPMEEMKWIRLDPAGGYLPEARMTLANMDAVADQAWEAAVARVHAEVDEQTRTLPLTLEIQGPLENDQSPGMELKPGSFVMCRIFGRQKDDLFTVPRHLLKPKDRLFLATDGHLEIRPVRVLRKVQDVVYIDAGLDPGDQIITTPVPGAVEGMALDIRADGE